MSSVLLCPNCGDPSDSPLGRLLKADYSCNSCRNARERVLARARRRARGLRTKNLPWSEAEDTFLYSGAMTIPGRTYQAVCMRRAKLGIRSKCPTAFTDIDIAFIKRHHGRRPVAWIADQLGRSEKSISMKTERLGLGPARVAPPRRYRLTERQHARVQEAVREACKVILDRQAREEVTSMLVVDVLARLVPFDGIAAAVKRYRTRYYDMHPERGAPKRLDAKVFDDGEMTLADTISSDVNMWECAA